MIKVLAFSLYGQQAASTRYRITQYIEELKSNDINIVSFHLLGDEYLNSKFNNKLIPFHIMIKDFIKRIYNLLCQNNYDLIIIHCELIPYIPGWIELLLIRKPYIYDFDDAFYLKYHNVFNQRSFPFLKNKFNTIIKGAAAVTAGSKVLALYATKYNSKTLYLPTVVDTKRYRVDKNLKINDYFIIGWIGSPSTGPYLDILIKPLTLLSKEIKIKLVVVGAKSPKISNITIEEVEWDVNTEINIINSFDVGVMPLPDNNWAKGKCAFKIIQYMACGVPVIASPVGANVDVVDRECGFLASTSEEWVSSIRQIYYDKSIGIKMGKSGRMRVEKLYSLEKNLPILSDLISSI